MRSRGKATKAVAVAAAILIFTVAAGATAAVIQQGNLRITVLSLVQPYKLPRTGTAPIAVFVSGHVGTADGGIPPQLQDMTIKVNRHGLLQSQGLPVCPIRQIQASSTERALLVCKPALVGSGQFWAHIILPGQNPYPTRGRLLIFNGREEGRPVLLTHIFTSDPFASSFVITFKIRHMSHGTYGTQLSASFPEALGTWGYVDRIKLTLRRLFRVRGVKRSYFNAGCPAPKGFNRTIFPLAFVSFGFESENRLGLAVSKSCAVRE